MTPRDLDVLFVLGRIESETTDDVGLDLLRDICCLENYQQALTSEDRRFLYELKVKP